MSRKINVMVWNEHRFGNKEEQIKAVYPEGIHMAIANFLKKEKDFEVNTAILDEPEHGLTQEVLDNTDVLLWWGHIAHDEVSDEVVERIHERALSGMGLIVLHSGHLSKILKRALGTSCSLKWREIDERSYVWNLAPGHEITQGVGDCIKLEEAEMYGEPFGIPEPDKLIFVSWFQGGEVFRSGCVFERGNGRIFYFAPGHETYPIYHQEQIQRVIVNGIRWAAPRIIQTTKKCPHIKEPLEKIS